MSYSPSTPKPPTCDTCGAEHFPHDACRPRRVVLWAGGVRTDEFDTVDLAVAEKHPQRVLKKRRRR